MSAFARARADILEFGARIRAKRETTVVGATATGKPRHMSLRQLAELIDVPYLTIHGIEHGRVIPDDDTAARLEAWLADND